MTFPLTYRDAMHQLAELAAPGQPAYIRAQALGVIISELSPNNPRHREVLRALEPPPRPRPICPEAPLSSEQQTDFHLHPVPADPVTPALAEVASTDDEDSAEEEDDPW